MVSLRKTFLFAFALALTADYSSCVEELPSSIKRCKVEDNKCLVDTWNHYVRIAGSEGIPELDVPKLAIYQTDKLAFKKGGDGPINAKLELIKPVLDGFERFVVDTITGFERDPKKMSKFVITGHCERASAYGKYKMAGRVLLIPITGNGNANITFHNAKVVINVLTKTETRDGAEYLLVDAINATYTTERNTYKFENILNNPELTDTFNTIVNENQDILNQEIIDPVSTTFRKVFKNILSPPFKKFPYRSFFLDA